MDRLLQTSSILSLSDPGLAVIARIQYVKIAERRIWRLEYKHNLLQLCELQTLASQSIPVLDIKLYVFYIKI